MTEHRSPIPARVYNAAVGGHVCGPEDVDFGQKVVHLVKYDRAGNEVSFESQITQANKIYVIHDDFVLSSNVTIPANCVLEFDGGSISGAYTLTFTYTYINGDANITCLLSGTVINDSLPISWINSTTFSASNINLLNSYLTIAANSRAKVVFDISITLSTPIVLPKYSNIDGDNNDINVICANAINISPFSIIEKLRINLTENILDTQYCVGIFDDSVSHGNVEITMRDCKIYGPNYGANMNGAAIKLESDTDGGYYNILFQNMRIQYFKRAAHIEAKNTGWINSIIFEQLSISGCANGFVITGNSTYKVTNCKILNCEMQGGHDYIQKFINADYVDLLSLEGNMLWDWGEYDTSAYLFTSNCIDVYIDKMQYLNFGYSDINNPTHFSNNKVKVGYTTIETNLKRFISNLTDEDGDINITAFRTLPCGDYLLPADWLHAIGVYCPLGGIMEIRGVNNNKTYNIFCNHVDYKTRVIYTLTDTGSGTGSVKGKFLPIIPTLSFSTTDRANIVTAWTRMGSTMIGASVFDTTLGKPVWWDGSGFVDATGATV